MTRLRKPSSLVAFAAALSTASMPVAAADLSAPRAHRAAPAIGAWDGDAVNAQRHRRHRHDGIDAGDVIAGVLILGGIAAVASAVSEPKRERYERYPEPPPQRYRESRAETRYQGGNGIDGAVDQCLAAIERDVRVDTVDNVSRNASGWQVSGTLYNGDGFTCRIGSDGRIEAIDYGRGYQGAATDRQWDDQAYADARARVDGAGYSPEPQFLPEDAPQPAYPGGPLPGEIDGDIGG